MSVSRRWLLATAFAGLGGGFASPGRTLPASRAAVPAALPAGLAQRALDALQRYGDRIVHRDVIGIAEFSLPSSARRFHLLDLTDYSVSSHWVAHGRGSDPAHTGWLERFSNEPHSYATSAGAYLTADTYHGAHGRSLKLEGLEASNSNAAARAIVVHAAPYVGASIVERYGMLGRSLGCLAVEQDSLEEILTRLAAGRLIYADRA